MFLLTSVPGKGRPAEGCRFRSGSRKDLRVRDWWGADSRRGGSRWCG
jgi:hypothetical protein